MDESSSHSGQADVVDALISERIYKPPFSHDKARDIIIEGKGRHFDPAVVEAFEAREAQFRGIVEKYAEHEDYEYELLR